MKSQKHQKKSYGKKGEELALDYLRRQGYAIIALNWRCPYGEIDIIAEKQSVLIFVEVRARHAYSTEAALASINQRKRQKIQASASCYLHEHRLEDHAWRIDVIAIATLRSGETILKHVEDALGW